MEHSLCKNKYFLVLFGVSWLGCNLNINRYKSEENRITVFGNKIMLILWFQSQNYKVYLKSTGIANKVLKKEKREMNKSCKKAFENT